MNNIEFVKKAIIDIDETLFNEMKEKLLGEYIPFSIIKEDKVTPEVLAEKLIDYFEKVSIKTNKTFDKLIDNYAANLDSITSDRIAKTPKTKRNEETPEVPRARKYYDKAVSMRKANNLIEYGLIDYSRIMMCLYAAIIKNKRAVISDLDYSSESLNINIITDALRKETTTIGRKPKYNTTDSIGLDRCFFVTTIMIYYMIKDDSN